MTRSVSGNGDEVEDQAAAWAIRSAERELTSDEQRQLDDWLAGEPRRLGAYVRAQAIWMDVDRVAALDGEAEPEAPPLRHWPRYAMAACLAGLLAVGGFAWDRLPGRETTTRAEIREVALDDGSVATLDGDSVMQVRFGGSERRVVLRVGQASFRVAHGDARPFLVTAGDVTVRATGTDFSVGMNGDEVEVLVSEGTVQVTEAGRDEPPRAVTRNEEVVAGASGIRRLTVEPAEMTRRMAWRRGMLVFDGQLLGRAAQDVNRYSEVQVAIDEPSLQRAQFMGVFRIGDGRAFAMAAAQAFNGQVVERDGRLHVMRASNSPSH